MYILLYFTNIFISFHFPLFAANIYNQITERIMFFFYLSSASSIPLSLLLSSSVLSLDTTALSTSLLSKVSDVLKASFVCSGTEAWPVNKKILCKTLPCVFCIYLNFPVSLQVFQSHTIINLYNI